MTILEVLAVALGLAWSVLGEGSGVIPAAADTHTAVCTINVTLSITASVSSSTPFTVTTTPAAELGYQLSTDQADPCTGLTSYPIALTGNGAVLDASCEAMVMDVSGSGIGFSFDSNTNAAATASGNALAQAWVFKGIIPQTFDAAAELYGSPSQMAACEQSGLSAFHFSGTLYYQSNQVI